MWNEHTSIDDTEVIEIKNLIQQLEIAGEEAFEIQNNLDAASEAVHYPIIFLIDISKSLKMELDNLNMAIYNFINDIYKSRTTLSASIDFCMITFNGKVKVRRPFGYISEEDCENNCKAYTIQNGELCGKTYMASALFTAWHVAEQRKKMYQEAGIRRYKPPIFVLISDLGNNELTEVNDGYLIHHIVELFNQKGSESHHKLALLKALYGETAPEYDDYLDGIQLDAPENFGKAIHELFSQLLFTIEWQNENEEDEDDTYIFIPKAKGSVEQDANSKDYSALFGNMTLKH